VVSASARTLGLMQEGRTRGVVNSHEIITGEFTRNTEFRLPAQELRLALEARLGAGAVRFLNATALAERLLGNSIYSNMMILGAAWQAGLVPLSEAALLRAIELNGAGVEGNARAFALGRWAWADPEAAARQLAPAAPVLRSPDEAIAFREAHLTAYQSPRLARRYRALVDRAPDPELRDAIARGYHKLLSYKDEYEVGRLHRSTRAKVAEAFEGEVKLTLHMAPPILSRTGPDGRPKKRAFGEWLLPVLGLLSRFKALRGTALDPFGYSAERRMERALIAEYEADMDEVLRSLTPATLPLAVELAALPLSIRGFGPVKAANARRAADRRAALLARLRAGGAPQDLAAE
jgi:indolepyruvate ferredoxin oxidoreductase